MTPEARKRLVEERGRLGLTQRALAKAIGKNPDRAQPIYRWENGTRSPNSNDLEAMRQAGIDIAYVLTGGRLCSTDGA